MKTHILKQELRRAFGGSGMKLAIPAALALAVWEFVIKTLPVTGYKADGSLTLPLHLWNNWLGGEMMTLPSYLYRLLLPMLAVLPFAASYATDHSSGYIGQVVTRTKKSAYLRAKVFAVWLSGGVAALLPLVFNFLLATAVLPLRGPQRNTSLAAPGSNQIFGALYAESPLVYHALRGLLLMAFCGAMALVALFVSLYVKNRFVVLITPFTLYLSADVVARRIAPVDADVWLPMQFLHPYQWMTARPAIVFGELAVLLLFGVLFYILAARRDTL